MATDGQRAAFRRVARDLAQDATIWADIDIELDEAAGALDLTPLDPTQWDRAVALLAACRIRLSLPQQADVAGPVVSEGTSEPSANGARTRTRAYKPPDLPAGYPASWYRNSSGHQLIELYSATSAALPIPC